MLKNAIRKLVDDTDHGAGKVFALVIQFLILLSLLTFAVDTLPALSADARRLLFMIEVITVAVFTVEYGLRIYVRKCEMRKR